MWIVREGLNRNIVVDPVVVSPNKVIAKRKVVSSEKIQGHI